MNGEDNRYNYGVLAGLAGALALVWFLKPAASSPPHNLCTNPVQLPVGAHIRYHNPAFFNGQWFDATVSDPNFWTTIPKMCADGWTVLLIS